MKSAEVVWDAGVVVVASAGNYGRDAHFTITSPGNSRKVITVGSLTDNEHVSTHYSSDPTVRTIMS